MLLLLKGRTQFLFVGSLSCRTVFLMKTCRSSFQAIPRHIRSQSVFTSVCGSGRVVCNLHLKRLLSNISDASSVNAGMETSVVSAWLAPDSFKSDDAVSLLNLLGAGERLSPEQTWMLTNCLVETHYSRLCSEVQWLQSNVHIAHIQLRLRDAVKTTAKPIHEHVNYQAWHDLLMTHADQFSDVQLADCFLATLYLGVPLEDALVHRLLLTIHAKVSSFNPAALATTSNAIKGLPGFDFALIRVIVNKLDHLCAVTDPATISSRDAIDMITIVINTIKLLGAESVNSFIAWFKRFISCDSNLHSAEHLGTYLRACRTVGFKSDNVEHAQISPLVERLVAACERVVDRMDGGQVAEICNALKWRRCYEGGVAALMEKRAVELLADDSRMCDVSNLMYALTRSSDASIQRRFQGALHARLARAGDVDVLTLSNIADVLCDASEISADLVALVQRHIAAQAGDIMLYVTRFNKIIRFVARRRFLDADDERRFTAVLLGHLDNQLLGIWKHAMWDVALILLSTSQTALPLPFFRGLMAAIPDWRESELYRLTLCVNALRPAQDAQLRRQVVQILGCLQLALIDRLDRIESLERLLMLSHGLVVNNRNRDPVLSERLLAAFPKYMDGVTPTNLKKVVQVFRAVPCYLPGAYDELARFLVDNEGRVEDSLMLRAVGIFSHCSYAPRNSARLLESARGLYERLRARRSFDQSLSLLVQLMTIQLYPEVELSRLFTLEEIEDIERYSKEHAHYGETVARSMMELNRAVVLECPQLDVPWFHEDYCLQTIARETALPNPELKKLTMEVGRAVHELVGGDKYVGRSTHSSYYHTIDFECALNKKNKPVKLTDVVRNDAKNAAQLQRIAICVMPESSYCYNSKQLIGRELVRKRHLEILEYKFVEVAFSDWYSMGLSEWESKIEYLRTRIFG